MSSTYRIVLATGGTADVTGTKFAYYISNVQHWFFVHKYDNENVVSHLDTGARAAVIPHHVLFQRDDDVAAAKQTLDELVQRYKPEGFLKAIKRAKPLPPRAKATRRRIKPEIIAAVAS